MIIRLALVLLAFVVCLPQPGAAHDARPLHVEIAEEASGTLRLNWRAPASIPVSGAPRVTLSDACTLLTPPLSPGLDGQDLYRCPEAPDPETLGKPSVLIEWPGSNPSVSTLLQFSRQSGEQHTGIMSPDQRTWALPQAETASGVAMTYLWLGITHILKGLDHLLFLVCLLWIARTWARVLITVLGFTVAHSITLTLSALDIVRLPVPPVEAVIALSILFLAIEIAKGRRDSLTWRYPITVSSSFGLLHGLGFAAVLADIGLPQTQLVTGLLFFNIGVEVGQLIFLAAVWPLLTLGAMINYPAALSETRIRTASAYALGTVASVWMVERIAAFF